MRRTDDRAVSRTLRGIVTCVSLLIVTGAVVFVPLLLSGRSNIYDVDGLTGHVPALLFTREILLRFIAAPLEGLPMWTWRLGFGADVVSTISYYVADPFAIISLAFPTARFELAYLITYWIKLLCAGLAAYAYLRTLKCTRFASSVGSILYVYSTFSLFIALRHAWFVNPMIWLPLILIGIEHVLTRRKPYLLIVAVALAAANNFYFFFMLGIITVIYAIARYFELSDPAERWSGFASTALRVAGWLLLGVAVASVVLIPIIFGVLGSSRFGSLAGLSLLHPLADYAKYLLGVTSSYVAPRSAFMGYSILTLAVLPPLFMRRREHTTTKFMVVFFAVVLAVPALGSLFNGLGFVSYRVMFAWGLFLAAGAASVLSGPPLRRAEILASAIGLGLYGVGIGVSLAVIGETSLLKTEHRVPVSWQALLPVALGFAMLALLALDSGAIGAGQRWSAVRRRGALDGSWALWGVVVLVVANLGSNAILLHTSYGDDSLDEYLRRGVTDARYAQSRPPLEELPAGEFYRIDKQQHAFEDTTMKPIGSNDALAQGYNGLTSYYSILNRHVYDFLNELHVRSRWIGFGWSGLDDRVDLLALASVRYYVALDELNEFVPYGYEQILSGAGSATYENQLALPIGYLYERIIPRSSYERLSTLGKQQALLQGAVIEPADAGGVPSTAPWTDFVDVPYTVQTAPGVTFDAEKKQVVTKKAWTPITLTLQPVPDADVFVEMTGVHAVVAPGDPGPRAVNFLYSVGDGPAKMARTYLPAHNYYFGDHTQFVNLGYRKDGAAEIIIQPNEPGTVRFDSLKVYAAPSTRYVASVQRLRYESMSDVVVTDTTVRGKIDSARGGFLAFSIPYSSGWSAEVDGRPQRLRPANTAFMGLPLTAGNHEVVLRYRTPGLVEGAVITLAALVFLAAFAVIDGRAEKRRRDHVRRQAAQREAP